MAENTAGLRIETLGGLSIRLSGQKLSGFASRKAEAILVYVAAAGQAVPRSVLANLFWEDSSESRASTNLRVALSSLKKQLGPFVEINRQTVRLRSSKPVWLDTLAMERHLFDRDMEAGLALYKGEFLEGFHLRGCRSFEDWQTMTREHYLLRIRESLHEGVKDCRDRQALSTGLRFTRKLLDLDPFDEVALRASLELLARTGQRNAALQQYERFEEIYARELDVEPDPATRELYDRIRDGAVRPDSSLRLPNEETSQPETPPRGNLPEPLTPFVGRETEMAQLRQILDRPEVRLVTILGPGGSGKTRLGLAAGKMAADTFENGAYFVALQSMDSPEALLSAIFAALSFHPDEAGDQKHQLLHYLSRRKLLLVLDNFETILQGAPLVTEILQAAANIKVLITSREKLKLVGEHIHRLGGLEYGMDADRAGESWHESERFFLQTARRLSPAIDIDLADRDRIARICSLVEGMPLAIELAASWTDTLTLSEIGDQIQAGLDILDAELGDLPPRHQNIRLVFDATFESLDAPARACFTALSVFRGSFNRQAAGEITGATIRQLKTLVRKSLLTLHINGRYQLHELLRQYAAEKLHGSLHKEMEIKGRHCRYYQAFLSSVEKPLKGHRLTKAEEAHIVHEVRNLRAAFRHSVEIGDAASIPDFMPGMIVLEPTASRIELFSWAIARLREGSPDTDRQIAIAVLMLHTGFILLHNGQQVRGRAMIREACELLERAGPEAESHLHSAYLTAASTQALGPDYDYAPHIKAALENKRNTYDIRLALQHVGTHARLYGDLDEAARSYRSLLELAEPLHERNWLALAHFGLGLVAEDREDFQPSLHHMQESVLLFTDIGNWYLAGVVHKHLGLLNLVLKQYPAALEHARQYLALFEEIGIPWRIVEGYMNLGEVALVMGSPEAARAYYERAEEIFKDEGYLFIEGYLYGDLGWLASELGEDQQAARIFMTVLDKYSGKQTENVIPHVLARGIPLLESCGEQDLVARIAVRVLLKTGPAPQPNTKRMAMEFLDRIKDEQGVAAYEKLSAKARSSSLPELQAAFGRVLQGLLDSAVD